MKYFSVFISYYSFTFMINRKNTMNHEEYGHFIDIENHMTGYFPDNLKSMSEKYKIRSINTNFYKLKQLNKFNINVNVNIMTTIPEINENSSHTRKKMFGSFNKFNITIIIFCVICFKYYYFLHNFV